MKTYNIELQRVKAMRNGHGLVEAQIDALVLPSQPRDDNNAGTVLSFSEATARVLLSLLKAQLADIDKRKGRSQR